MTAIIALAWAAVVILGAVVGHLVEEWALRGERPRVSPDLALSIETHTAGGVKASDLVMCPPRASLRRRPLSTRKRKPSAPEAA